MIFLIPQARTARSKTGKANDTISLDSKRCPWMVRVRKGSAPAAAGQTVAQPDTWYSSAALPQICREIWYQIKVAILELWWTEPNFRERWSACRSAGAGSRPSLYDAAKRADVSTIPGQSLLHWSKHNVNTAITSCPRGCFMVCISDSASTDSPSVLDLFSPSTELRAARTADRRDGARSSLAPQLWCEARCVVQGPCSRGASSLQTSAALSRPGWHQRGRGGRRGRRSVLALVPAPFAYKCLDPLRPPRLWQSLVLCLVVTADTCTCVGSGGFWMSWFFCVKVIFGSCEHACCLHALLVLGNCTLFYEPLSLAVLWSLCCLRSARKLDYSGFRLLEVFPSRFDSGYSSSGSLRSLWCTSTLFSTCTCTSDSEVDSPGCGG